MTKANIARQRQDLLSRNLKIPADNGLYTKVEEWHIAVQPDHIEDSEFNTELYDPDRNNKMIGRFSSVDLEFKQLDESEE